MDQTSIHLENCELIAPVTALGFVHTQLLVGEGPYLSIYETRTGERSTIKRIFDSQRIHRIQVCDFTDATIIAVCGGKATSVIHLQQSQTTNSELSVVNLSIFCDWIWDLCFIKPSSENQSIRVALVTGHNAVWLWDVGKNEKYKLSQCQEQCILYCARFIRQTSDTLWLACGTVFNEVLLWKVQKDCSASNNMGDSIPVSKRLSGHDGLIFSVAYNKERKMLCSVSDDRSVKVWKLEFDDSAQNIEASAEPLLTMYGHKARVWDCLILPNYIITIGEDSLCLVWNSAGEIIKRFTGHIGKSIWSLAGGSTNQVIATGGGDGSVRLWSLIDNDITMTSQDGQHVSSEIPETSSSQSSGDIPRCLGFLPDNDVLVLTDKGNFYRYTCFQDTLETSRKEPWEFLRSEPEFCSYSVMALSPCRTVVALGNIQGNVKLFSTLDMSWNSVEMKPYSGKVLSLDWITDENETQLNLFSCGPEGKIVWWTVRSCVIQDERSFVCDMKSCYRLPYCRQRWPNSVFIVPNEVKECGDVTDDVTPLVLLGDRRGSLHVFKGLDCDNPLDPLHSYLGIHGRNGVTHITSHQGFIYTTGRDGYFRQYKLKGNTDGLDLVDKRKVFKGLDWIERLNFTSEGDLLVLGFHTIDFVIWSTKRQEILHRVACGGGHRVWDTLYKKNMAESITMLTYLKKMTIHVHKLTPRNVVQTSIVLQESFHGREATCVRFIQADKGVSQTGCKNDVHLMVTGSEDTTINILAYIHEGTRKRLIKLSTCPGHISSVRCLELIKVPSKETSPLSPSSCDYFLFSGGGRAALKCWSVNLSNIGSTKGDTCCSITEGEPVCTLHSELPNNVSRYKRKRFQRQRGESSCDVRFMSLCVFSLSELLKTQCPICGIIVACSDGKLRSYAMDSETKTFDLIHESVSHDKCLLTVGHFITDNFDETHLVVYSADTVGKLQFWDYTRIFLDYNRRSCEEKDRIGQDVDDYHEKRPCYKQGKSLKEDLHTECTKDVEISNEFGERCCLDVGHSNNERLVDDGNIVSQNSFYEFKLHQSGVNCVKLQQANGQYMLYSGGDDGALSVVSFKLGKTDNSLFMDSWSDVAVPDAHTSSATGVSILQDGFFLSTSVDQRLKVWKVDNDQYSKKMIVTLVKTHFIDVADVQDVDVETDSNGTYYVAVCGVGLQVVTLHSATSTSKTSTKT